MSRKLPEPVMWWERSFASALAGQGWEWGAGDRCLASAKFLTTLTLEVSVSDQFRVHCVLEWNKVLILLSD